MARGKGGGGGGKGRGFRLFSEYEALSTLFKYVPEFHVIVLLGLEAGRFFGEPSKGSPDDILKQVAVARGLRDGSELLVSLGKQRNGMTFDEAMNIMEKELGLQACIDYCRGVYYSEPTHCKRLLQRYNKNLASGGAFGDSYRLATLEKYCGYRRGDKE